MTIQELEAKRDELQAKKDEITGSGFIDPQQLQAVTDQLNAIINQISQIEYEAQQQAEREQAIEEKVQAEAVPFAVAGIGLDGVPVEVIKLVEAVVKADRRRIHNEQAIESEQAETDYALHVAELDKRINELQSTVQSQGEIIENGTGDNRRLIQENGDLRDHTAQQHREIEDLTNKLANASALLDEYKRDAKALNDSLIEENRRLRSEIDDYQKSKVFGEREAQGIIDVTPTEQTDIAAALESVKKLYTKRDDTFHNPVIMTTADGQKLPVTREEAEAEWAPMVVPPIGGSESAESFRNESGEAPTAESGDSGVPTTPVAFRGEDTESTVYGMGEGASTETGELVSRQEFQALAARVAKLEDEQVGETAA